MKLYRQFQSIVTSLMIVVCMVLTTSLLAGTTPASLEDAERKLDQIRTMVDSSKTTDAVKQIDEMLAITDNVLSQSLPFDDKLATVSSVYSIKFTLAVQGIKCTRKSGIPGLGLRYANIAFDAAEQIHMLDSQHFQGLESIALGLYSDLAHTQYVSGNTDQARVTLKRATAYASTLLSNPDHSTQWTRGFLQAFDTAVNGCLNNETPEQFSGRLVEAAILLIDGIDYGIDYQPEWEDFLLTLIYASLQSELNTTAELQSKLDRLISAIAAHTRQELNYTKCYLYEARADWESHFGNLPTAIQFQKQCIAFSDWKQDTSGTLVRMETLVNLYLDTGNNIAARLIAQDMESLMRTSDELSIADSAEWKSSLQIIKEGIALKPGDMEDMKAFRKNDLTALEQSKANADNTYSIASDCCVLICLESSSTEAATYVEKLRIAWSGLIEQEGESASEAPPPYFLSASKRFPNLSWTKEIPQVLEPLKVDLKDADRSWLYLYLEQAYQSENITQTKLLITEFDRRGVPLKVLNEDLEIYKAAKQPIQ